MLRREALFILDLENFGTPYFACHLLNEFRFIPNGIAHWWAGGRHERLSGSQMPL
jgi:hypothetical protein